MARMNITDVEKFGERLLYKVYQEGFTPIIIKRFKADDLTRAYSPYEDIVRHCQTLFNVHIFRNQSSLSEGIYLFGRTSLVNACHKWLTMVITRVEQDTVFYGNIPRVRRRMHGNESYSRYRSKRIKAIIKVMFKLTEYRDISCNPVQVKYFTSDALLTLGPARKDYSVLKNKTKYNALRYTA